MAGLSLREQLWQQKSSQYNSDAPSVHSQQQNSAGHTAAPLAAAKALYAADLAQQVQAAKEREAAARAASRQEAVASTGLGIGGADYDRQRMANQQAAAQQRVEAAASSLSTPAPRQSMAPSDEDLPGGGGLRVGSRSDYDRVRMRRRQEQSQAAAQQYRSIPPSSSGAPNRADSPDLPGGGGLNLASHDRIKAQQAAIQAERARAAALAAANRAPEHPLSSDSPHLGSQVQQRSAVDAKTRRHDIDREFEEERQAAAREKAAAQAAYAAALQAQIQQKEPKHRRRAVGQEEYTFQGNQETDLQYREPSAQRSAPPAQAPMASPAPKANRPPSPELPGGGGLRIGSRSDYDRQRMQRRQMAAASAAQAAAHLGQQQTAVPKAVASSMESQSYVQHTDGYMGGNYIPVVQPGEYFPQGPGAHHGDVGGGFAADAPHRETPPYLQHRGRADPTRGPVHQHAAVSLRDMHNGTPDSQKMRAQMDAKQRYRMELEEQMAAVAARKAAAKAETAAEDERLLARIQQQARAPAAALEQGHQGSRSHHPSVGAAEPHGTEARRSVLGQAGLQAMQSNIHSAGDFAPGGVGAAFPPPRHGGMSDLQAGMTDEQLEAKRRAGLEQAKALQAQIDAKAAAKAAAAKAEADWELQEERRLAREQAELAQKHQAEVEAEERRAAAQKEEEERAANAAMAKAKRQAKAAEAARLAAQEAAEDARVKREQQEMAEKYAREKAQNRPLGVHDSAAGMPQAAPPSADPRLHQLPTSTPGHDAHRATGAASRQDLFGPPEPQHNAPPPTHIASQAAATPTEFNRVPQTAAFGQPHSSRQPGAWAGQPYEQPNQHWQDQATQQPYMQSNMDLNQGQHPPTTGFEGRPPPPTGFAAPPAQPQQRLQQRQWAEVGQQLPEMTPQNTRSWQQTAMETSMLDGSSHFVDFSGTSSPDRSRLMEPIVHSKPGVWRLHETNSSQPRAPASPILSPPRGGPARPASSQEHFSPQHSPHSQPARVSTAPSEADAHGRGLHGDTVKMTDDDRVMEADVPVADIVGNLRRQLGVASRAGQRQRGSAASKQNTLPLTARSLQGQSAWIGEHGVQSAASEDVSSAGSVSSSDVGAATDSLAAPAAAAAAQQSTARSRAQLEIQEAHSSGSDAERDSQPGSPEPARAQTPESHKPLKASGEAQDRKPPQSPDSEPADKDSKERETQRPGIQSRASSVFDNSKDDWLGALAGDGTMGSVASKHPHGRRGYSPGNDDDFSDTISVGNMSVMSLKSTTDYEGMAQRNAARLAYLRDLELAYNNKVSSPRKGNEGASSRSTSAVEPAATASMIDSVLQQYLAQAGLPLDTMDKSLSLPPLQLPTKAEFPSIDTDEPLGSSRVAKQAKPAAEGGQYDFATGGLKPTPIQQHPSAQFAARSSAALAVPETVMEEASARSKSLKHAHKSSRRRRRGKRRSRRHSASSTESQDSTTSSSESDSSSGSSDADESRPMSASERSAQHRDTRASMHLAPTQVMPHMPMHSGPMGFHTSAAASHYQVPQTVYVQSVPQAMPMYSSGHMGMPIGPMGSYGMPMQYVPQSTGMLTAGESAQAGHSTSQSKSSKHKKSKSSKSKKASHSAKLKRDASQHTETPGAHSQSQPVVSKQNSATYDLAQQGAPPDTYRSLQGNSSWLQRD